MHQFVSCLITARAFPTPPVFLCSIYFFFLVLRRLPTSTLFPYTTLFRSLNKIAPHVPWLLGGSADLTPSTKTRMTFAQNGKKDRKSTRLNSSHVAISYAVFCLKKKIIQAKQKKRSTSRPREHLKRLTCRA